MSRGRDLAAEFGVSLVLINEAMNRLENEYLIENTADFSLAAKRA